MLALSVFLVLLGVAWSNQVNSLRGQTEGSFTIGHHTYASKQEFILSGKRCGTEDLSEETMAVVENKLASMSLLSTDKRSTPLKVNVYFNVIKNTNGDGTLSDAEINSQMTVLNNAFAQVNVKFVLKRVKTTINSAWFTANYGSAQEKAMKKKLRISGKNILNIYTIANSEGILGWATFPVNVASNEVMDGVVIDYRTLPGGVAVPYNEGATMIHEVGHWMGLYHTFQGGCATSTSKGDAVADTPAVKKANFGCPADTTDTCPGNTGGLKGNDMIHNYMDYTDDACMYEFTKGQQDRIDLMWTSYRA